MNNGFRLCAFADESKKSKIRHNYSLQTPAFSPTRRSCWRGSSVAAECRTSS